MGKKKSKTKVEPRRTLSASGNAKKVAVTRDEYAGRVQAFRESGDAEECAKRHSMAYLLFSLAEEYAGEAVGYMERHGLNRMGMKSAYENMERSFDSLCSKLDGLLLEGAGSAFMADHDNMRLALDTFMNGGDRTEALLKELQINHTRYWDGAVSAHWSVGGSGVHKSFRNAVAFEGWLRKLDPQRREEWAEVEY